MPAIIYNDGEARIAYPALLPAQILRSASCPCSATYRCCFRKTGAGRLSPAPFGTEWQQAFLAVPGPQTPEGIF
jgi:hypothetical protein